MGQCLLSDTPPAVFQVVLHHLSSQDFASLRQVSRAVCQCTTQLVPYITLLLTGFTSGSIDQLQQWSQATKKLQHISNIHIHVACHISSQLFNAAIQLLAQRSKPVTELHLLALRSSSSSSSSSSSGDVVPAAPDAWIPDIQQLQYLLPHLHTLVIKGIAVQSLVDDLITLAAVARDAGGCPQLQSLTLSAEFSYPTNRSSDSSSDPQFCHWVDFADAIRELLPALPYLKQLHIKIPSLMYIPQDVMHLADLYLGGDELDDSDDDVLDIELIEHREVKFAHRASVAVLANVLVQLKSLEVLSVSYLPDMWCSPFATAVTEADAPKAAARAAEFLYGELLPSAAAAEAAFPTLDDYGCWLLQHLANLKELQLHVGESRTSVSWQWWTKQQSQQLEAVSHGNSSSSSSACQTDCRAAADVIDIALDYWMDIPKRSSQQQYGMAGVGHIIISSSSGQPPPPSYAIPFMSSYSFRSSSSLARHISSCQLNLYDLNVDGLADFLGDLKSLKHLTVGNACCSKKMSCTSCSPAAATAVVAAAATVQGLQSFTFQMCGPYSGVPALVASDDLLLPLTAAAGGPGSNLKKLVLEGNFKTVSGAAPVMDTDSKWLQTLQQLDGLRELIIINHNRDQLLNLSVESLPAGLEVLEGERLCINKSNATAAAVDHEASSRQLSDDIPGQCTPAASHSQLQLRKLQLTSVQLSSPVYPCKQAAAAPNT